MYPRPAWAGSSVGTSDRLKSDRSAVRPRPCPQAQKGPDHVPIGALLHAQRSGPGGRPATCRRSVGDVPEVVEGAFPNGVPYLRIGRGPVLLVAAGLTTEHVNPKGAARRVSLSWAAPFAEHFTVYLVNRRPGLSQGTSMSDLAADYATVVEQDIGGPSSCTAPRQAARSPSSWQWTDPSSSAGWCSPRPRAGSPHAAGRSWPRSPGSPRRATRALRRRPSWPPGRLPVAPPHPSRRLGDGAVHPVGPERHARHDRRGGRARRRARPFPRHGADARPGRDRRRLLHPRPLRADRRGHPQGRAVVWRAGPTWAWPAAGCRRPSRWGISWPAERSGRMGRVLPRLEVVRRLRPIDLLAPDAVRVETTSGGIGADACASPPTSPPPRPCVSGLRWLAPRRPPPGRLDRGGVGVPDPRARRRQVRSRRFHRAEAPTELGLTLTGTHLTGWTREQGQWVARARYDLPRAARRPPRGLSDLRVELSFVGWRRRWLRPARPA